MRKELKQKENKKAEVDQDADIRTALRDADEKGKLGVVAAVVGLTEPQLRAFMNGDDSLDLGFRAMLRASLE